MSIYYRPGVYVKYSDVKSRFSEETKRKPNMIIDYNKSIVEKYIQVELINYIYCRAGKNYRDIVVILILIFLLLIILFVSKNQNQPTHAILYYLIKIPYYMPLLTLIPNSYIFIFQL